MDSSGELRSLPGRDDEASEGLEEGEVEGETLLIVESEDQASVDLSHDQSGDSLNSDMEAEAGWGEDMAFYCDKCHKWIPMGEDLINHWSNVGLNGSMAPGANSWGLVWPHQGSNQLAGTSQVAQPLRYRLRLV